ncbi:hypothetical protein [Streptomyces deserti]
MSTGPSVTLRRATSPADADAAADVWLRSFAAAGSATGSSDSPRSAARGG